MTKTILSVLFSSIPWLLWAGPDNIAPKAKATVSSSVTLEYGAANLTDGIIGIDEMGEWASFSGSTSWGEINYPSLRLEWNTIQSISRIVLYDRATSQSHTASGILRFEDGSRIAVHAIPNDGTAKTVDFPAKTTRWVEFEVTDGDGLFLGLSEIEVFSSFGQSSDYVSKVNPFIESGRGRYFFFTPGSRPFGMISAAPMTRNKNQYGGGYNYNSLEVLGFPQVHCWMLGGINLMPTTGNINPSLGEQSWKSRFSHDGEIAQPGYQRLYLNDYKVWTELTSTDRVSFYRFRFTEETASQILLSLGGITGNCTMNKANVTRISDTEISGSVNTTGRFWGGPENVEIYFVMCFDKPFNQMNGWDKGQNYVDITTLQGSDELTPRNEGQSYADSPPAGVSATYQMQKGEELQVKIAISYVSVENARQNMDIECNHWNFDAVRTDSRNEWNEWLGKIDVKGGTEAQQMKFYTDLWHVLLGRHKLDDVNGQYPDRTQGERFNNTFTKTNIKVRTLPKDKNGQVKFHMYNSDGFWLTHWNLNVLWGLAWPEVLDEFAACLVQYAQNGGEIPRGPSGGGYSYIMTSCPGSNMLVAAYQKNIMTKTTPNVAFKAMQRSHRPGGMIGPEDEIKFYIENGYYPGNAGITLETAFQDWSLAQMAMRMGKKKEANYYLKRSSGWVNLFRPEFGLIFPKDAAGNWLHDDPLINHGWVEANAWQGTWSLSHAIPELSHLMGGNDILCQKLNYAFEQSDKDDFVFGYGSGFISYANQPGCSNAHVFNYAGAPWLSQYWVRKVNEQAYGAITPDKGYGGHDEDQGQMGGISALMSLGLFSLQGTNSTEPVYELTSPVFDEIIIKLDARYYKGNEFRIKVYNNSKENIYIRQTQLNGEPHNDFRIKHADYAKGGVLEMWLDSIPNKEWGVNK